LCGGADAPAAATGRRSTSPTPTSTTTSSTTTTALVVEHVVLAPGVTEVATARPGRSQVQVRATPPPGWDATLTPVVAPDAAVASPPRSAADVARVPLPSVEVPIAGRAALGSGWLFEHPGRYQPPQPLTFGVVQRQGDWLEVQLPVRPNGTTGWVSTEQVEVSSTARRVEVSVATRQLRVVDDLDTVVFEAPVSVGRPSTPTPTGRFHVTDLVPSVDPAGPYGPLALALDGYSEVMDRFGSASAAGSPDDVAPVLAVHGTNRPDSIGRAASNGCPRLDVAAIGELAALVPAGTPVDIWP
ncbi:MAG: L,D-transpeptidase, partial [Microthrixaceae bacterium]